MAELWLGLGYLTTWLTLYKCFRQLNNLEKVRFNDKANIDWQSVMGSQLRSPAWKLDSLHIDPPTQSPHPYISHYYIKGTLLPALTLNIGIGCKLWSMQLSNINSVPRDTGLARCSGEEPPSLPSMMFLWGFVPSCLLICYEQSQMDWKADGEVTDPDTNPGHSIRGTVGRCTAYGPGQPISQSLNFVSSSEKWQHWLFVQMVKTTYV